MASPTYQLSCKSENIARMVFEQGFKRSAGLGTLLSDESRRTERLCLGPPPYGCRRLPKPACYHGIWVRCHAILTESIESESYSLTWFRLFHLASSGLLEALRKGGVWVGEVNWRQIQSLWLAALNTHLFKKEELNTLQCQNKAHHNNKETNWSRVWEGIRGGQNTQSDPAGQKTVIQNKASDCEFQPLRSFSSPVECFGWFIVILAF